jgi:serine/threonine protein kinase
VLPVEDGVRIAIQVAEGLGAAHAEGVIHRDLKPHNVMFDAQGRAKLLDFGIARLSNTTSHTVGFTGTPHYMSPEQAEGRTVTHLSDVYALGVLLFEIFTGKLPFEADSLVRLAVMHAQEAPPAMETVRAGIPPAIQEIVSKCLVKDSTQRYQSADQVAEDLRAFQEKREPVAVPAGPVPTPEPVSQSRPSAPTLREPAPAMPKPPEKKSRTGLIVVLALLVLAAIGGGTLAALRSDLLSQATPEVTETPAVTATEVAVATATPTAKRTPRRTPPKVTPTPKRETRVQSGMTIGKPTVKPATPTPTPVVTPRRDRTRNPRDLRGNPRVLGGGTMGSKKNRMTSSESDESNPASQEGKIHFRIEMTLSGTVVTDVPFTLYFCGQKRIPSAKGVVDGWFEVSPSYFRGQCQVQVYGGGKQLNGSQDLVTGAELIRARDSNGVVRKQIKLFPERVEAARR